MEARVLRIKRQMLEAGIRKARGKARFARAIGVHATTLNGLLGDTWDRIERDTIEQLCAYLDCRLEELFTIGPSQFWQPLRDAKSYRVLRGVLQSHDVKTPLEENAKTSIINSVHAHCPGIKGGFAPALTNQKTILALARKHNCIVIGANSANASCEVLISRFFGATPFDRDPENRSRIPFRIVRPGPDLKSAFIESPRPGLGTRTGYGIISEATDQLIVETDWLSEDSYLAAELNKGHDAGLVLVANKPFETVKKIKFMLIAGFSSAGTLAAAQAVARDYKELEPLAPGGYTIGIVDAIVDKAAGAENRELRKFSWVYLEGGRRRVRPKDAKRTTPKPSD